MIEWGRLHHGRVWHLLKPSTDVPWCGEDPAVEFTQDQPPRGGRPCPACCARIEDVSAAVDRARRRNAVAELMPYAGDIRPNDIQPNVTLLNGRPVEDVTPL